MARKIAYIHLRDHHDPIWNKPFEQHIVQADRDIIRSYAEREEQQLDRWLEILPGTGATLEIEQGSTLRKYLERNPEKREAFHRLVDSGQIEFLASGETVIDCNVVIGESLYRNKLQYFKWVERTFGVRPRIGAEFDTFGQSAQMPQVLRQFGLKWLALHSRMFGLECLGVETEHVAYHPPATFWRGLDGSIVCHKRDFADQGIPTSLSFVNYQYRVCPECRGHGCRFCGFTGMDNQAIHAGGRMESSFRELAESSYDAMRISCETEETVKHPHFFRDALALGRKYNIDVRFDSHRQIMDLCVGEHLAKLDAGTVRADEIDIRREGNPLGTGCYTTRCRLKRENRELEHLLLSTERFAALAARLGHVHPTQALAELWRRLSLTQAHDALTGNHPDGPYMEMLWLYRTIRLGAGKRLLNACRHIAAHIDGPAVDNAVPVAVFNALTWPVEQAEVEIVIPGDAVPTGNGEVAGWTITAPDGQALHVLSHKAVVIDKITHHRLTALCRDLPPCGYTTVLCRPTFATGASTSASTSSIKFSKDAEHAGIQAGQLEVKRNDGDTIDLKPIAGNTIENSRYRITWDDRHVTEIFDKALGKTIAGAGTCDLWAEDEIGTLWERTIPFNKPVNMTEVSDVSLEAAETPNGTIKQLTIRGRLREAMAWDIPETWARPMRSNRGDKIRQVTSDEAECCLEALTWRIELRLTEGDRLVRITATIDCDSQNIRLRLPFVLGFTTPDNNATYEIPYGMFDRPSYQPKSGVHLAPDGVWPAIHWAAAVNKEHNYTCAILNRGVPAYKFFNGVMELTLLRSGRLNPWLPRKKELSRVTNPLATDSGEKRFDLALYSGAGDVAVNRLVHRGYEFNAAPTAIALAGSEIEAERQRLAADAPKFPGTQSFVADPADHVMITAIKQAEDSDYLVMRLAEVYGKAAQITPPAAFGTPCQVGPMEDDPAPIPADLAFGPFQIRTLRYDP